MKRTLQDASAPLWLKRLFMALAMIATLLGIVVVPAFSHVLVKGIFDTIEVRETVATSLGGASAVTMFIGYICVIILTDMFGLSHQKNWK